MRKTFFILIISSIMFCVQDKLTSNSEFSSLSSSLSKFIEFKENGVRLEYFTKESVANEFESIKKRVEKNYINSSIEFSKNEIQVKTDTLKIYVNIFNNENKTDIEIDIINFDKTKNIDKLIKEIKKIKSENCYEVKYFKYIKGKIYNEQQMNEYINSKSELQNINILSIHNGYVGTANLFNGERLNFANISYNTGSYLVIGSPIIITTY